MRLSQREPSGVFFVDVFSEHPANRRRGILSVNVSEENREVTHVHGVFLLKVPCELSDGDSSIGKSRPSPMVLTVHDAQEFFLKSAFRHGTNHVCCLPHERL